MPNCDKDFVHACQYPASPRNEMVPVSLASLPIGRAAPAGFPLLPRPPGRMHRRPDDVESGGLQPHRQEHLPLWGQRVWRCVPGSTSWRRKIHLLYKHSRAYKPGMTVRVWWSDWGGENAMERDVEVPRYGPDEGGRFAVHFLRGGEVKGVRHHDGPQASGLSSLKATKPHCEVHPSLSNMPYNLTIPAPMPANGQRELSLRKRCSERG